MNLKRISVVQSYSLVLVPASAQMKLNVYLKKGELL